MLPARIAASLGATTATAVAVGLVVAGFKATPSGAIAARTVEAGPTAALSLLPVDPVTSGAESAELRTLRTSQAPGALRVRCRSSALFVGTPAAASDYARPAGLRIGEIRIPMDAGVDARLAEVTRNERAHAAALRAMTGAASYRAAVDATLRVSRIPPELAALAFVESGFDPTSGNASSAGLWCLTSDVAQSYGLVVAAGYDERRSLHAASAAAARYLADLHERFGSWELAIVAFGVGYRATVDALAGASATDPWTLLDRFPRGGLAYLRDTLAAALIQNNADRFGLDEGKGIAPEPTSDLEVPAGAPLGLVAQAASVGLARLRTLNPEYTGDVVPSTDVPMFVHVPADSFARAKEALMPLLYAPAGSRLGRGAPHPSAAPQRPLAESAATRVGGNLGVYYRTHDGDTLDGIARRFNADLETIARDNALDLTARLPAGQLLMIRSRPPARP